MWKHFLSAKKVSTKILAIVGGGIRWRKALETLFLPENSSISEKRTWKHIEILNLNLYSFVHPKEC